MEIYSPTKYTYYLEIQRRINADVNQLREPTWHVVIASVPQLALVPTIEIWVYDLHYRNNVQFTKTAYNVIQ